MAEIFRKKSLDRINSPEELDKYMQVTNPPIWFGLVAVILILVGAIIWGCTTKLDTTVDSLVVSDGTSIVCYVSEQDINSIEVGSIVKVDGVAYTITVIGDAADEASVWGLTDYQISLANFEDGEEVYRLSLDGLLEKGNYTGKVVLNEVSPFSFLFNSK